MTPSDFRAGDGAGLAAPLLAFDDDRPIGIVLVLVDETGGRASGGADRSADDRTHRTADHAADDRAADAADGSTADLLVAVVRCARGVLLLDDLALCAVLGDG